MPEEPKPRTGTKLIVTVPDVAADHVMIDALKVYLKEQCHCGVVTHAWNPDSPITPGMVRLLHSIVADDLKGTMEPYNRRVQQLFGVDSAHWMTEQEGHYIIDKLLAKVQEQWAAERARQQAAYSKDLATFNEATGEYEW